MMDFRARFAMSNDVSLLPPPDQAPQASYFGGPF